MKVELPNAESLLDMPDQVVITASQVNDALTLMGAMEMTLIFIFVALVLVIGLIFGRILTSKWHA